jgi:hypothetical protein
MLAKLLISYIVRVAGRLGDVLADSCLDSS